MWRAVISSWAIAAVLLLGLVIVSYAPLAWTDDPSQVPTSHTKVAANC